MTQPKPKTRFPRRSLLFSLLTLFIVGTAWVAYFLATFDLNDYRRQAEEQLASLLSMPVKIGQIRYNFYEANVALKVDGLQLGNEETTLQADVPRAMVSLKWRGLFVQDIRFAEISLDKPKFRIRVDRTGAEVGESQQLATPFAVSQSLLSSISINELEIFDGVLRIEQESAEAESVVISDIDGELSDIGLNKETEIIMTGDLKLPGQAETSKWQLEGEAALSLDDKNQISPRFNLNLEIKTLDLGALNPFIAKHLTSPSINGSGDLHLTAKGDPDDLDFQVSISSRQVTVMPGNNYLEPVAFKHFLANGRLRTRGDSPGISKLSLQIDKSRLAGDISWAPAGQPFVARAALYNSDLAIAQIKQWLPDDQGHLSILREKLKAQGTIKLEHAKFSIQPSTGTLEKDWRVDSLKGAFENLSIESSTLHTVDLETLSFNLNDSAWQISEGNLRWGSQQLAISGSGEVGQDGLFVTTLDFKGEALPEVLLTEFQTTEHYFSVDGSVPFKGHFSGPVKQLKMDVQGDLSQLSITHKDGLELTPKIGDSLSLHGTLTPEKVSLDHGALKWSMAKGHVSGAYQTDNPDSLSIDALLIIDDLTELSATLPILSRMQLRGQADLAISQRGLPAQSPPEMTLTLRDAGLKPTEYIADLNRINGRVKLTLEGLAAERLQVYLGESPMTVDVELADFTAPSLSLDVKGASVRARDVVFHSETAMLRDIGGQLEIDGNGLVFNQIGVRLDGGTDASVKGVISFKPPYDIKLDITSEFAKISEIVNLWSGKKHAQPPISEDVDRNHKQETKSSIVINAQVENGNLYGMKFQKASGVITPTRKRLTILPLDFSVDEGFCNAQVIADFSRQDPTMLRISGHAEDVDALVVYQELLNMKNIVRGKLRGDFYISGEIGPNYLPSSYGEFSVEVNNGVLHQFQVLSKVFSLLNVSQIFALSLPDMDLEGMPFDRLSANYHLDKGVIKSDDLRIESRAMNQAYVGQVDLVSKELDLTVQVHPLGTVDKIISSIPVAGWLLTGENKAFLTAHFSVTGEIGDPIVKAMPLETLSDQTIGLLKRTIGLPFKLAEDPQILWGGDGSKQ